MTEQTCPACGMPRSQWKGNDGRGVTLAGETYCCNGCASGNGCTCT